MNPVHIDFQKTALVLIDLQKGIVKLPGSREALDKTLPVLRLFRDNGGFVCFVRVAFVDGKDSLRPATDQPAAAVSRPADWAEFAPELEVKDGDYMVTKRQWGAFHGTDLDLQLRRRGIDTIVLCGIATNIGVESTAREAFQYGYDQIFITDAMTTFTAEEHEASCRYIFPKIGKLRTSEAFLSEVRGT